MVTSPNEGVSELKEFTRPDLRFAACAALFDGEVCIGMYRTTELSPTTRRRYYVSLRVAMTSRQTVERMHCHFGAGTLKKYRPRPGRQTYWTWFCGAKKDVNRNPQAAEASSRPEIS